MYKQYLEYIKDTDERKHHKVIALYKCTRCGKNVKVMKTLVNTNKKLLVDVAIAKKEVFQSKSMVCVIHWHIKNGNK